MNDYKISVVVRTYNEEKHLGELLDKLESQTYTNYEVVVVDSESTDNTREIALQHQANVVSIRKSDFNYSYSSNVGVANATGDVVCFLSGHSVPVKDTYLQDMCDVFNANPTIGGCYGDVVALPDGSWVEKVFNQLGYLKNKIRGKERGMVLESVIHPGIFSCSNAAARRDLLIKYPFVEELGDGGEDIEVAYRMIQDGFFVAQVPELLVMHSHGIGLIPFLRQYKNWKKMYQDVCSYISLCPKR